MKSKLLNMVRLTLVPLVIATIAACGSDTTISAPPGSTGVTENERVQIEATLNDTAVLRALYGDMSDGEGDPSLHLVLEMVIANATNMGTIDIGGTLNGTYRAFGGQVVLLVTAPDEVPETHTWAGIIAMNELENPSDIIIAGISNGNISTIPSSFPSTPMNALSNDYDIEASGAYIRRSGGTSTLYESISGQMSISSAAFSSSSKTCASSGFTIVELMPEISLSNCKTQGGALKGSFGFTATQVGGTATVTIPNTAFNLPANRTSISVFAPENN